MEKELPTTETIDIIDLLISASEFFGPENKEHLEGLELVAGKTVAVSVTLASQGFKKLLLVLDKWQNPGTRSMSVQDESEIIAVIDTYRGLRIRRETPQLSKTPTSTVPLGRKKKHSSGHISSQ